MEKTSTKQEKTEVKNKQKAQRISKAKKTANSIKKNKDTPKVSGSKPGSENKNSKAGAQDKKVEGNILQMIKTMKPKPAETTGIEKENKLETSDKRSSLVVKEEYLVKPLNEK